MKNIIVDYDNSVISISSAFKKKAFTPGTKEYNELNTVRHDYPDFPISVREFHTNTEQDRYKGLTYDYMRWYIENKDKENGESMLKALDDMIDVSKCHSKGRRYPSIKKWFLETYSDVATFGMTDVELANWEKVQKKSNVTQFPATGTDG
ncbi:MAG: hypothetical protein IJ828_11895 [Treponema sp.]|nr:hypothetical protein [Treponema sp.]